MDARAEKCLAARRESKTVEFKESFDPADPGSWCEILKDIVAIANTGGGAIAIGLDSHGNPSGANVAPVLAIDPAVVTDKVAAVTGQQFTDFEIAEVEKDGQRLAVISIGAVTLPMVFEKVGNYHAVDGRQKTAFAKGTVYFRHGAKSEPGNNQDIQVALERRLAAIRKDWLAGVKKVVHAPEGTQVAIVAAEAGPAVAEGTAQIRIVDDPAAPAYRRIDYDLTHPYRQKDLIAAVNQRLPAGVQITTYDVLTVRRVHNIDDRDEYCHQPKFGSLQYSEAFANWLVGEHQQDNEFFAKARQKHYDDTH